MIICLLLCSSAFANPLDPPSFTMADFTCDANEISVIVYGFKSEPNCETDNSVPNADYVEGKTFFLQRVGNTTEFTYESNEVTISANVGWRKCADGNEPVSSRQGYLYISVSALCYNPAYGKLVIYQGSKYLFIIGRPIQSYPYWQYNLYRYQHQIKLVEFIQGNECSMCIYDIDSHHYFCSGTKRQGGVFLFSGVLINYYGCSPQVQQGMIDFYDIATGLQYISQINDALEWLGGRIAWWLKDINEP